MEFNYIHWNIDPEIFNVFGISIRYYGLLFVSGLILCVYLLGWIYKRENIPPENLDKLTIYAMIGIMVGARLGHCLFYEFSYYISHPVEMILPIRFLQSGGIKFTGYQGLASHGGVLGLLIALILYSRKTKHSLIDTIDLIAVVAPLTGVFIRLANLMNSEIIGIQTSKSWGFIFERVDNVPRHPAQLYEAIMYFTIFTIMVLLYKYKRGKFKNGFFFGLVAILVFVSRFFIEFIKEKQVGFEEDMFLNMGQILSIPYIIVGLSFMAYGIIRTKKNNLYDF